MKTLKFILVTFVISLAVWCIFSFPLPLYVSRGIASSAWNIERGGVRTMVPGDHLQMLYHYWLFRERVTGNMGKENIYEFNYGKCYTLHRWTSFLPFSALWTLFASIGGSAMGYNLMQIVVIWWSVIFGWLFVRRYSSDFMTVLASVLAGVMVPYGWAMLFGGSSTGPAMMWIPAVLLGLDMVIREERVAGAFIAGAGMLLIALGDPTTFLFTTLSLPAFCLIILLGREDLRNMGMKDFLRLILLLLIPAGFILVGGWIRIAFTGSSIAGSTMRHGREMREVSIFSYALSDMFGLTSSAKPGNVYVGFAGLAVIVAGLLLVPRISGGRALRVQYFFRLFLVLLGIAGVILITLGVNGPAEGLVFRAVRKVIPYFKMIRQPSKSFCLFPSLLMLGACFSLGAIFDTVQRRKIVKICALAVMIAMFIEYKGKVRATVSVLVNKQNAYECIAVDAKERGENAHAIVIPIWPGDSHFSSAYLYYASLYRIRLVNGYRPVVPVEYVHNVFQRFESINKGYVTDSQLDELMWKGVRYIILHEDLFPEKVSPFAVSCTLMELLRHPRLKLVCQDGAVWAFKIHDSPLLEARILPKWDFVSSARVWEVEKCDSVEARVEKAGDASKGEYLRVETVGGRVQIPSQATLLMNGTGWLIRMRGKGFLRYRAVLDDRLLSREPVEVDSEKWRWFYIPAGGKEGYGRLGLTVTLEEGYVDMDMAMFVALPWKWLSAGESMVFPACVMFHGGYTAPDQKSVILRREWEASYPIFYSPGFPLEAGLYEMVIEFSSDASSKVRLAEFTVQPLFTDRWIPLIAGEKQARIQFEMKNNLPVFIQLRFFRISDMRIHSVILRRLS